MKAVAFGSLMFLTACDNSSFPSAKPPARYVIEQAGFTSRYTAKSVLFYTSRVEFIDIESGKELTLYGTIRIEKKEAQP